ncbi:Metalloenzyme, LuxS/M16 peptidase-like protein [Lipomyces arxii]|uniref:Metalloenzyme, LuxS/M16 peptidase-like protein n=1 Tax=Lipomyces arxii TaxID=56418 RepID=UPI0034CFEB85
MPFDLVTSFDPEYCPSTITKWRSTRTGLQIVLIEQERPIVEGYFAVATEIADDSGCPHTLEHLIFMGSKKHPYKGLLDTLGNRAFSNTNAWTATDSTVYTLSTAGWEGFRLLLPVYLDHLINPTLTDSACYTEVYHVDGEGNEKGVVFSEMQGVENEAETIAVLRSHKIMYPESSGYSSETGGLMGALRVLTSQRIREFYYSLYRPDNLCLILVGTVDKDELLDTVSKFDDELPSLDLANPKPRPFVDSPKAPHLTSNVIDTIDFPDKDESSGHILLSFFGPSILDFVTNTALHCLMMYLTDSDISLLRRKIVEIENPLSTELEVYTDDYIETGLNIWLHNVPTEELGNVEKRVFEILKEHIDKSEFNLEQIRDVVERERLQYILSAERYPSTLANLAIEDFVYGTKDGKTLNAAKTLQEFDTILKYETADWEKLMQTWFLYNPHAAILAKPSASLAKQLRVDGKERLQKRREELGEAGLANLTKRLKEAQDENERKIPNELLSSFPAPDPAKVKFIESVTAKAGLALSGASKPDNEIQSVLDADGAASLPLYVHYEHVKSNFVSVTLALSTAAIPEDILPYLFILLSNFYATPIVLDDGTVVPYEEVVKELKKDTIVESYHIGFDGEFYELVTIELQVVPKNYQKAIDWFKKLIWNSKFDPQRLQIVIEKTLMGMSEEKRDGSYMVNSASRRLLLNKRSARRALEVLEMESLLKRLCEVVKKDPSDLVSKLEQVRTTLFTPENVRIVISADIKQLSGPVSSWTTFLPSSVISASSLMPIPRTFNNANDEGRKLGGKAYLLPVPATESSYATLLTNGPTDFKHPDIPALAVAVSYLEAVEGPFWRGIRGNGLAYGAGVLRSIEVGNIGFRVYRAADAPVAIARAKEIVESYATGATAFEPLLIDGAISIIVSAMAEADNSYYSAASRKFLQEVLKDLGPNANQNYLASVRAVKAEAMQAAVMQFLMPIFSVETSHVFIACNPSKLESTTDAFEKLGYEVLTDPFGYLGEEEEDEGGESGSEGSYDDSNEDEDESGSDTDEDGE